MGLSRSDYPLANQPTSDRNNLRRIWRIIVQSDGKYGLWMAFDLAHIAVSNSRPADVGAALGAPW